MANTYVAIATTTVGSGGASNFDFTSIPATYDDLLLHISSRSNRSAALDYWNLRFNNDSGNNYSSAWGKEYGPSVYEASTNSSADKMFIGWVNGNTATSNTFATNFIYIPNYLSSEYKSVSSEGGTENNATANNDYELGFIGGLWSSTSSINRITLLPAVGTLLQYSTVTLYGIKKS